MDTNKLKSRDLITLAIFTVLLIAILMLISLPFAFFPSAYVFKVPIELIPCGIIWAYLRVKVPKRFSVLIPCAIISLITFLAGVGLWFSLGALAGGIVAELISGIGRYKSAQWNCLSYVCFGLGLCIGEYGPVLLARESYYRFALSTGSPAEYMDEVFRIITPPMMALVCILAVAGAVIGMLLGRRFLKKHIEKAGIV